MELISSHGCFNGEQRRYRIESEQLKGSSTVGVFLPPSALATPAKPVPALIWLSGLTCSDENFVQKAGAQRRAAELGLALITPDTSPRGDHVPTDPAGQWDFGFGAGFYVDAEQEPWSRHYRMHSFVLEELPSRLCSALPLDVQRLGLSGHSMGGHGALVLGLRHPDRYRSVSAVAPISHPSQCPWGQKAFGYFFGTTPEAQLRWRQWDAVALLEDGYHREDQLLVDLGSADPFLQEQLRSDDLSLAAANHHQRLALFIHEGYDHSYFFVASVIDRHLEHHAKALGLLS
ncbi:S-formylglutathione hydrolase [Synechococcus sp. AH-603-M21]|nr:S-formylglutathione hydrolase [Synechococcus sp. AH-603-M21]